MHEQDKQGTARPYPAGQLFGIGHPVIRVECAKAGLFVDGIEGLIGSAFDDQLTGDATANLLQGGAGNDALSDGAGNDTVEGGDGDDTLIAGAGADNLHGGSGNDLLDYGGTDAVIGKNILRSAADLLAQLPSTFNAVNAVSPQSTNARPWSSSRLGNQPIMLA